MFKISVHSSNVTKQTKIIITAILKQLTSDAQKIKIDEKYGKYWLCSVKKSIITDHKFS